MIVIIDDECFDIVGHRKAFTFNFVASRSDLYPKITMTW